MSEFAPATATQPGSPRHKKMLASCQSNYLGKKLPTSADHFLTTAAPVSEQLLAMFGKRNGSLVDNDEPKNREQAMAALERAFSCLVALADSHGRCIIFNNRCVTKTKVGGITRLRHIADMYSMKALGTSCWHTQVVTIRKSDSLEQQVHVLAHEIAHQMFNHGQVAGVSDLEQEAQAELTGYLLLHALGVSWQSSQTVYYLTSKMPAEEAVRAWSLLEEYAGRLVEEIRVIAHCHDEDSQTNTP